MPIDCGICRLSLMEKWDGVKFRSCPVQFIMAASFTMIHVYQFWFNTLFMPLLHHML